MTQKTRNGRTIHQGRTGKSSISERESKRLGIRRVACRIPTTIWGAARRLTVKNGSGSGHTNYGKPKGDRMDGLSNIGIKRQRTSKTRRLGARPSLGKKSAEDSRQARAPDRARTEEDCASSSLFWTTMACAVRRRRFSSGWKAHPATAPAGSNRSSHGGNEMAEAFD
jgi:hypothetical protein